MLGTVLNHTKSNTCAHVVYPLVLNHTKSNRLGLCDSGCRVWNATMCLLSWMSYYKEPVEEFTHKSSATTLPWSPTLHQKMSKSPRGNSPTKAVAQHCHKIQQYTVYLTRKWARARGGTHPRKQCHSTATKFNICTSAIPYSTKPHRITQAPLGHGTESHKIKQQFYNILLGSGTEPHKIKQNPLFDFVWFGVVRAKVSLRIKKERK